MIGESDTARATVRRSMRPRHERKLGADLAFIEGVLEKLRGWPNPDAPVPEGVLSFVRHDFNDRTVAALGREIRLAAVGPQPKSMHLCADPDATVYVFETDLADEQAHIDVLARRELGPRTMVLYTPATRLARVVCDAYPWPGLELDMSLGSDPGAWTVAKLNGSILDFNADVVLGTPFAGLVTNGRGLRPGGRRRYNEALYLHLRYGLGGDRWSTCAVRIVRTGLGLRPRGADEERLTMFGRRSSHLATRDEADILQKCVDRWAAGGARQALHIRCLCCDPAAPCTIAQLPTGLTIEHPHL